MASIDSDEKIVGRLFLEYSSLRLQEQTKAIHRCFENLDDDLIWKRGSPEQNSIGNLVLHLCGNVRQWIGAYVGGRPDVRNRPTEFSANKETTCAGLLALLDQTMQMAAETLATVEPHRLAEPIPVQDGQTLPVLHGIYRVVTHFDLHVGQIMFATKLWTGQDLGIYRPKL